MTIAPVLGIILLNQTDWMSTLAKGGFCVIPTDYKDGVMQDVHWYSGSFGYFPSYALGQLYGAMFYEKAIEQCGAFDPGFEKGEFSGLHEWLRSNIYAQGMRHRALDLVQVVTGEKLSAEPFIRYLSAKFGL